MLTAAYHMLKNGAAYQDLGAAHFARPDRQFISCMFPRPLVGRLARRTPRECYKMDERQRFVARFLEGEKMAVLCREFDISRKTGYKIFKRYEDCGVEGLTDRSRRPYRHANRLPGRGDICFSISGGRYWDRTLQQALGIT
jgi:hypothetical protein